MTRPPAVIEPKGPTMIIPPGERATHFEARVDGPGKPVVYHGPITRRAVIELAGLELDKATHGTPRHDSLDDITRRFGRALVVGLEPLGRRVHAEPLTQAEHARRFPGVAKFGRAEQAARFAAEHPEEAAELHRRSQPRPKRRAEG